VSRSGSSVVSRVELRLVRSDSLVPVATELSYDPADPYAVALTMNPTSAEPVRWLVARDVLRKGLTGPAGEGEVGIWPSGTSEPQPTVCVALSSPDGDALLVCDAPELAEFLDRTEDVVPIGEEDTFLDLDGLVAALLS
jgi:sporulation and cell division protein SsgA